MLSLHSLYTCVVPSKWNLSLSLLLGADEREHLGSVMCPPGLPQDDSRDDGLGPADLGQVLPDGESSVEEHSITPWISIFSTDYMRYQNEFYTRGQSSFQSEVFTPVPQPISPLDLS